MKPCTPGVFDAAVLSAAMLRSAEVAEDFSFEQLRKAFPDFSSDEIKELRTEADRGNAEAQLKLGATYWVGKGVDQNTREGVRWWRKAAEQGDANAQFMLGMAYLTGVGIIADAREGYIWLTIANVNGEEAAIGALQSPRIDFGLFRVDKSSAKKEAAKRMEEIDRRKEQSE